MSTTTTQSPWTGTNFWIQLVLLVGSAWGMTQDFATMAVTAVFGIISAAMAVRGWIVNAKFKGGKGWITDPNTWSYLTSVILALIPAFAPVIPLLHNVSDALFSGNISKIITAGFALLTMIYYTFIKKPAA